MNFDIYTKNIIIYKRMIHYLISTLTDELICGPLNKLKSIHEFERLIIYHEDQLPSIVNPVHGSRQQSLNSKDKHFVYPIYC
jgi:hypothetical protein